MGGFTDPNKDPGAVALHSQILVALAEGGLFGGAFFFVYGAGLIWTLYSIVFVHRWNRYAPFCTLILLSALWDFFCSPFSGAQRVSIAMTCGLIPPDSGRFYQLKPGRILPPMNPLLHFRRRFNRLSGRSKAVGLFFATSVTAGAFGICCPAFAGSDRSESALGTEAFGLWMALASIGTVIMFADFGMAQECLQNKLAGGFCCRKERMSPGSFAEVSRSFSVYWGYWRWQRRWD